MLPNSEWILLALLAVILLKPEDVPKIAKFLAKAMRQAQHLWNELALSELNKHNATEHSGDKHSEADSKKHPFNLAPPKAKSGPMKD
jgi:Sec-independent protein translocase protein TatA